MKQTNSLPMVYHDYVALQNEFDLKSEPYHRLKTLIESQSMVGITEESWSQLNSLWKKLESQVQITLENLSTYQNMTIGLTQFNWYSYYS